MQARKKIGNSTSNYIIPQKLKSFEIKNNKLFVFDVISILFMGLSIKHIEIK